MAAPILYAGSRNAALMQVGVGYTDAGAAYNLLGRSERIAPAGPSGECIFPLLYVTTRHDASTVSFWITPYVDNVALATHQLTLTGAATTIGNRQTHELALYTPYVRSAIERFRVAPRGTWFEVQVDTEYSAGQAAKQIIESMVVEFEAVRETQQGEAR